MKKTTVYRRTDGENLFEEELTIEFLGIHTVDEIPDEKTVWHVKNILSKAGTFDALFSVLISTARDFPSMKAILSMPLLWKLPNSATPVRKIQICANQQIPAAAYCLYGIAVS